MSTPKPRSAPPEIHSQGGISMLTDIQGHIARIHPADAVAKSHSTETSHPHRLAGRGICLSIRETERHPRITGAPIASTDSAAKTQATHSASPSELVQRTAARFGETEPCPLYRDDRASRLAVASVTRQHTRRGPPTRSTRKRAEKTEKDKRKGIGDWTANQVPLTH